MNLTTALTLSLGEIREPVITSYNLGVLIYGLYQKKEYKGEKFSRLRVEAANSVHFSKHVRRLVDDGIFKRHPDFTNSVYNLLGRQLGSAEEVACTIDPFSIVSHLSAMAHHGLTNRIPHRLFLSSPPPPEWREEARKKMEQDLGGEFQNYVDAGMPVLTKPKIHKIGRTEVHILNTRNRGAFLKIAGSPLRVSKIGRVFLEMLRNPELCGGMRHVIETYEQHAEKYLLLVINEIDRNGEPIDKVRAGYILDERMKISNPAIEGWTRFAQRGGSRKLDSSAGYFHEWSEKWMLSLNLP